MNNNNNSNEKQYVIDGVIHYPHNRNGGNISTRGLENLKNYKYTSALSGWLDRVVFTPYWNWFVGLLPMSIAPNLITSIALSLAFVAQGVLQYYSPNLTEQAPREAYLLAAFLMFMYQTLDAVDGKQARRTGSSSPLGQLFDHGCDAICACLTGLILAATVQCGATHWALMLLLFVLVPFFVSNWEESCTGMMRFGIVGVTEGQLLVISTMLLNVIFGPQIWAIKLFGTQYTFMEFYSIFAFIGGIYQTVSSVINVIQYYREHEEKSANEAIRQIFQFTLLVVLAIIWFLSPTSTVFQTYPRVFLAIVGVIFCYQISELIICHVTGDEYKLIFAIIYPLPLIVYNAWFHVFQNELLLVQVYLVYCAFLYIHFVFGVIGQITEYLGIYCFSITKRKVIQATIDNRNVKNN